MIMKIRLIVAVVAVFAAFTGEVCATVAAPQVMEQSEGISPELLDQIAEAVARQCSMSSCEVREAYYEGEMEVEKTQDGYQVRLLNVDGGPIVIAILEEA